MTKDSGRVTNYSLATSWDDGLVKAVFTLNQHCSSRKVTELYGSFQTSITGSGRPPHRLPAVSHKKAREHIRYANKYGLGFNYIMNTPHFRGKENDPQWGTDVKQFITDLKMMGVSSLTITSPFLITIVKKEFPSFKINLSLIAGVSTVEEARRYEDMGVDVINLDPHTINRDFDRIKNIIDAVNCEIELYANIPCLSNCRNRDKHYELVGYSSQEGYPNKVVVDPLMAGCSLEYLNDPVQLLRSPFIRPEDVPEYKKLGVEVFKLSDRSETTTFLSTTAKAYMELSYKGNLFDLIFRKGRKFKVGIKSLHPEIVDREIPIVIDNSKLTELNFLQQIKVLKGKALDEFYEEATCQAVRGYGDETEQLKATLKNFLEYNHDSIETD